MHRNVKNFMKPLIVMVFSIALFSVFWLNNISSSAANTNTSVELNATNTWQSGGDTFLQVDGTITNNSNTSVDNWKATAPLASSGTVNSSWNMNYDLDDGILTITGVEHNKSIPAGTSVTFGMILMNPGDFDTSKVEIIIPGSPSNPEDPTDPVEPTDPEDPEDPEDPVLPVDPGNPTAKPVPDPTTDDWLFTDGNKIVDKDGKEVWLTGVNWFGYNTGTNLFDGVWGCNLNTTIQDIADRGFNLLRIPFSAELILQWKSGEYPKANYNDFVNPYLDGMNSLEIFDYVVGQCRANGIKIMIDIHSAETDAAGHFAPLWYTDKISEADYLASLSWIADRYKNDDTIIAYDLKNEPHGAVGDTVKAIWNDSDNPNNWKAVAEKAAYAVLSENPDALVLVEGIQIYPKNINSNRNFTSMNKDDYYNSWWGGNLRGVKDFPVNLGQYQNKLVYSPHDYGPAVSAQPWFEKDFTMQSLYEDCWRDNWMFIHDDNIAPLLIGEWGGFMVSPNLKWMTCFRNYIIKNKLHHTFWCFNANSGDTGGLVLHDFTTWDEEKYDFVKEALWQKDGKFVGLDHQIPLGANGITLSDY
ncbi:MAG TPA: cellulase family glycosylhydrolase [Clostridiales bacterium]|nr:cellulase family glycosylhydrolase [Clostridiales bacterium]